MGTDAHPTLFTIPVSRAFSDALADGLLARFGGDPLGLAKGVVLLPSNRARSAVQAAFVRAGGNGLLLPRLVALGDADLDEAAGLALDAGIEDDLLPPAVDPLRRRLILSRLIIDNCQRLAIPIVAPASLGLADALARVIDQLHFEGLDPAKLDCVEAEDLSRHWQISMVHLQLLLDQWPAELTRIGAMDLADRRNHILDRLAKRWRTAPPANFVVAAGVSVTAPAVARLLRTIADMPQGMVILPGLDRTMPAQEWEALGPAHGDAAGPRPLDAHPQYQFKLLLDRMGVARDEVQDWPTPSVGGAGDGRIALASALFVPSRFTANWRGRVPAGAAAGIGAAEFSDDAAEALGIALLLRHALETPGKTAALVTPDRGLAQRVSSALKRWGLAADDSAGQALAQTPAGAFARLALAAAGQTSLVPLLGLLSHPLVQADAGRGEWLARVRQLDLALRGPGMPIDPDGITAFLDRRADRAEAADHGKEAAREDYAALAGWWKDVAARLAPLWVLAGDDGAVPPTRLLETLIALLDDLSGGAIWKGQAGRQLAALFDHWLLAAPDGPALLRLTDIAHQLDALLARESLRQPFGSHPRLFIWGLLEARLQRADLMILGGLNEGGWPAETSPDPWLAPGIRRQLSLPSIERAQGLAAHDFVTALGADKVIVTRAERQGHDPAVASRLWLRLQALAGPLAVAHIDGQSLPTLVASLDQPAHGARPAARPVVAVPAAMRPRVVGVTALDTLANDPYAFYAQRVLRLRPLDRLGEGADARWRGTRVHKLLEDWVKSGADTATLAPDIADLANDPALDPIEAAAWLARIDPALHWIAAEMASNRAAGRTVAACEVQGQYAVGGIVLTGKADRIDRTGDGLIIVDYKSGRTPAASALRDKKAMQLGLLAIMAEAGAFRDVPPLAPVGTEYWLLRANSDKSAAACVETPYGGRYVKTFEALVEFAGEGLADLTQAYLNGETPFTPGEGHGDYDHLARRSEWIGRIGRGVAE